jgi:hypothetical protein
MKFFYEGERKKLLIATEQAVVERLKDRIYRRWKSKHCLSSESLHLMRFYVILWRSIDDAVCYVAVVLNCTGNR